MMPSSPKRHAATPSPQEAADSSSGTEGGSPTKKRRKVTHDEKFQSMFDRLVAYRNEKGDCLVPYRWGPDPALGKWVNSQRLLNDQQKLSDDRIKMLDGLGFVWRVKQRLLWDEMFDRLVKFKEANGHCLVPQRYKEDPQLGRWVDTQRENKDRRLTPEHKKRLDEIGFVWSALKESWDEMYGRLVEYKNQHGDCQVTQRYTEDPKLGKWVKNQRLRRDCLSADRVARLEEIGFVWCVQKKQERDNWDKMYKKLQKYREEHGNCLVPIGYKGDPQLADWVNTHRQSKGRLTAHQVKRLNAIEFEWAIPEPKDVAQVVWDSMYEKLAEYKKQHGTCDVPSTTSREDYAALALWVQTQRAAKLFGGITQEQVERLNALGFSWPSSQDYLWNHQLQQQRASARPNVAHAASAFLQPRRSQSPPWVSGWESSAAATANPLNLSTSRVSDLLTGGGSQLNSTSPWDFPSLKTPPAASLASPLNHPLLARASFEDRVFPQGPSTEDMLLYSLMEKKKRERSQTQQAVALRKAQELAAVAGRLQSTTPVHQAAHGLASLNQSSTMRSDLSSLPTSTLLALRNRASTPPGRPRGSSGTSNPFPPSG